MSPENVSEYEIDKWHAQNTCGECDFKGSNKSVVFNYNYVITNNTLLTCPSCGNCAHLLCHSKRSLIDPFTRSDVDAVMCQKCKVMIPADKTFSGGYEYSKDPHRYSSYFDICTLVVDMNCQEEGLFKDTRRAHIFEYILDNEVFIDEELGVYITNLLQDFYETSDMWNEFMTEYYLKLIFNQHKKKPHLL